MRWWLVRGWLGRGWLALALCLALGATMLRPALAAPELPRLTGEVVLTVRGLDPKAFPDGQMQFDLGRLKALGPSEIRTSTIWTDGTHLYTGVLFKRLCDYLGLTGGGFKAVALNDYAVEIPVSDATESGPILAYEMDGLPMSVRDKGPIWIIYPYDANPDFRSEVIYTRSIWQLVSIEVTH